MSTHGRAETKRRWLQTTALLLMCLVGAACRATVRVDVPDGFSPAGVPIYVRSKYVGGSAHLVTDTAGRATLSVWSDDTHRIEVPYRERVPAWKLYEEDSAQVYRDGWGRLRLAGSHRNWWVSGREVVVALRLSRLGQELQQARLARQPDAIHAACQAFLDLCPSWFRDHDEGAALVAEVEARLETAKAALASADERRRLEEEVRREQLEEEDALSAIREAPTKSTVRQFLQDYPNSPGVPEVSAILERLNRHEEEAFADAMDAEAAAPLEAFLAEHPEADPERTDAVNRRIVQLKFQAVRGSDDPAILEEFLGSHPDAEGSSELRAKLFAIHFKSGRAFEARRDYERALASFATARVYADENSTRDIEKAIDRISRMPRVPSAWNLKVGGIELGVTRAELMEALSDRELECFEKRWHLVTANDQSLVWRSKASLPVVHCLTPSWSSPGAGVQWIFMFYRERLFMASFIGLVPRSPPDPTTSELARYNPRTEFWGGRIVMSPPALSLGAAAERARRSASRVTINPATKKANARVTMDVNPGQIAFGSVANTGDAVSDELVGITVWWDTPAREKLNARVRQMEAARGRKVPKNAEGAPFLDE